MPKRLGLIVLVTATLIGSVPTADAADFKVLVHVSNPMESVTTKQLSAFFLKKDLDWPDGRQVIAVDLPPDSPIRASFSSEIHGKKVSSIKSYWQRQIFQGKAVPPMEKANQVEVIAFVALNPEGIGYVASSSPMHANVKELPVVD